MASFENLLFERTQSKKVEYEGKFRGVFRMSPQIKTDVFEFSFRGNLNCSTSCKVNIGVVDKNHQHDREGRQSFWTHCGNTYGVGWSLWVGDGVVYFPNNSPSKKATKISKTYKNGDTFCLRVSRTKNTIEFLLNGKSEGFTHENCKFPDELFIAISFDCGASEEGATIELVDFKDLSLIQAKQISEQETKRETGERLECLHEKCGEFRIPLRNKTLHLCKPFLIHSNIRNLHSVSEYNGFSDISLDVDEMNVLKLLLGLKVALETDQLFDYFRFFKRLGLKREMMAVLNKVSSQLTTFKHTFKIFARCCKLSETEEIKSWFSTSPQMLDQFTFHNSFSLSLFNKLKSFESELTIDSPLVFIPFASVVAFHIKKYSIQDVRYHHDFTNVDLKEKTVHKMFSSLFRDRNTCNKSLGNLILKTFDQKEISVHREVLLLKSNFFHKMFNFGGRETDELNKTSTVQLEDLGLKEVETIIRFYYLDEIVCADLEPYIFCMVHCHKYFEQDLLSSLMKSFGEKVNNSSEKKIRECLKRVGYLLESEELRQYVVSVVCRRREFSPETIGSILKKSEKNRFVNQVLQENRMLKIRVQSLEERLESTEERLRNAKERLKRLEERN